MLRGPDGQVRQVLLVGSESLSPLLLLPPQLSGGEDNGCSSCWLQVPRLLAAGASVCWPGQIL